MLKNKTSSLRDLLFRAQKAAPAVAEAAPAAAAMAPKATGVGSGLGRNIGTGMAEGAASQISSALDQHVKPFIQKMRKEEVDPLLTRLKEEAPNSVRAVVRAGADEAKDIGRGALKGMALPAGLGAASGAITAPEDEGLAHGVVRGGVGGVLGGLTGAATGAGMPGLITGSMLGGALGGGLGPSKEAQEKPMKNKYAGVTLDWYDDQGATLKMKFPTIETLPDVIKEADVRPLEKLANEDFALVAIDDGYVMRKFACHDPGTTAMSVIYFMEHGDKLPEGAQKVAAANLVAACQQFDLTPPAALVKSARSRMVMEALKGTLGTGARQAAVARVNAGRAVGAAERVMKANPSLALNPQAASRFQNLTQDLPARARALKGQAAAEMQQGSGSLGHLAQTEQAMAAARPAARPAGQISIKPAPAHQMPIDPGSLDTTMPVIPHGQGFNMLDVSRPEGMATIGGLGLLGAGGAGYAAHEKAASSNVIDITGKRPAPQVKVAASNSPDDYAVVLEGRGFYPIHTWDLVKKAEVYFHEERGRMQPEIRRQFAVKLAAKAGAMGYPLDPEIVDAGATDWATSGHLKAAVEMRKVACQPGEDREFLDELFEKRGSMEPETYAEVLRRFDVQQGLDRGWDRIVLDPWASTFGMQKVADVVWEDGNDRVTTDQLVSLAQNHLKRLRQILTEGMCKEFQKDPMGIFESMPLPQKRIIARLATDHPEQSEITQAVV